MTTQEERALADLLGLLKDCPCRGLDAWAGAEPLLCPGCGGHGRRLPTLEEAWDALLALAGPRYVELLPVFAGPEVVAWRARVAGLLTDGPDVPSWVDAPVQAVTRRLAVLQLVLRGRAGGVPMTDHEQGAGRPGGDR